MLPSADITPCADSVAFDMPSLIEVMIF
jgi:hypothetical protein